MYLHRPHIAEAFLAPYLLVEFVGCEEGVRVADEEGEDAIFHVGLSYIEPMRASIFLHFFKTFFIFFFNRSTRV